MRVSSGQGLQERKIIGGAALFASSIEQPHLCMYNKVNHLTAHAVAAGVGYKREDGGQLATSTPDHEADTVERLVGRS